MTNDTLTDEETRRLEETETRIDLTNQRLWELSQKKKESPE